MLELTKDELTRRLVVDHGYPSRGAALVAEKVLALQPSLQAQFAHWWETGRLPRATGAEYSVDRLVLEHGMTPIAAFLTLDWLQREPERARASLKRGHDHAIGRE